jgi:hypothetical protein
MGPDVSVTDYEMKDNSSIPHWDRCISFSHNLSTRAEKSKYLWPTRDESLVEGLCN